VVGLRQTYSDSTCLLCGYSMKKWFRTLNRGVGPRESFEIYRCNCCRSTGISPIPDDLNAYYSGYHAIPKNKSWQRAVRSCNNRLDVVLAVSNGEKTSLLDIGAGAGAFVNAAQIKGFQVAAIEQDEKCRINLESFIPGQVSKDLDTHRQKNLAKPDIITLWHVFEHIPNPDLFLDSLREFLVTGTKIIIEVPNADSLFFRFMRSNWPHLDAPRHVFIPSRVGIESIARKHGLKTTQLRNRDNANWGAFSFSNFRNNGRNNTLSRILRRLIQICISPLFKLESLRFGTTSTYVLEI
jgi:hypothetical protein